MRLHMAPRNLLIMRSFSTLVCPNARPDEEGIETFVGSVAGLLYTVRTLALTKKGLRLDVLDTLARTELSERSP